MAEPPLDAGAVHDTVTVSLPETPVTDVGETDTVAGITPADGAEATLAPTPFVAVTVKVYEVPLVSPPTLQVNAPVVVQVKLPGVEVTV